MAEQRRTVRQALTQLFSSKVILKRQPNDTLKAVNFDKALSYGNKSAQRKTYRGAYRSHPVGSGYHLIGGSSDTNNIEYIRHTLYSDYESMDAYGLINSALDIYAEEVTAEDINGDIISIITQDDKKKRLLYNLFYEVLDIEGNLTWWVRELCKYGDFFLKIEIHHNYGIIGATPINPANMSRIEQDGEVYFEYIGSDANEITKKEFNYHEIVHFRLGQSTNFLPYGTSVLEGGRNEYKKLVMLEDAMLIHRIMRAPDRRMVIVDVGALHPDDIDAYMEDIVNEAKRVPYKDENGNYNLRFNLMNSLEDIYIPSRGGAQGTKIENLPGLENSGQIDDIEYVKGNLLSFLKIPKPYLNIDENTDGKAMLANQDMRFAKSVKRIQQDVVTQLIKMAFIHLFMNGYPEEELLDFDINMPMNSIIARRQRMDLFAEQLSAAADAKELEMFSNQWIYENIFEMTREEWQSEKEQIPEDLKHMFRLQQIKDEGNDPKLSGEVKGTPHSMVMAQMASRAIGTEENTPDVSKIFDEDERKYNEGQPEKSETWETERDDTFGRDPTGRFSANYIPKTLSAGVDIKNLKAAKTQLFEEISEMKDQEIFDKYSKFINEVTEKVNDVQ